MLSDLLFLLILIILIPIALLSDIITLCGVLNGSPHSYTWKHKKQLKKTLRRILYVR